MNNRHFSASQLNMFLTCSARWKYRYIDGLKIPPSSALVQGKSFHVTEEFNFREKIKSGEDVHAQTLGEYYVNQIDTAIKDGIEWTDEEHSQGNEAREKLIDQGIKLVEIASKEFNPTIIPKEIEKKYDIKLVDADYSFQVITDIETDKGLHELKTTAKTPSEVSGDHLLQGTAQFMATGNPVIEFDYFVKIKTPKIVRIEKKFVRRDVDFLLGLTTQVASTIKSGNFIPNRTSWSCSRRQCGFYRQCEQEFGGRVRD